MKKLKSTKPAEADSLLSRDHLFNLVNSAMDAIISTDENQNIVMYNKAAEIMFGYKEAYMLGQPISLLLPSRFREVHAKHVTAFAKNGVSTRSMHTLGEITGLRNSGDEFPAEASISQSTLDGTKFFSVILREISERKDAEKKLLQSEERFNKAFQLSPVGMVISRLPDNRILDINNAWCEIIGYSREETLRTPTAELVKIDTETMGRIQAEMTEHGSVRNTEISITTRAGERLVLLASIELIKVGDLDCALTTFVDITARNQALEKLRASETHNRTLYEISEQRLRQTMALRSIDIAISNSLDLPFTLAVVLDQAIKELGVDAADILLYNDITHVLTYSVGKGFLTNAPQEAHVALGHGYAGRVILERKGFHLSKISGRNETEFDESSFFRLEGFEDFHCMPLIAKGKILGVLETFSRHTMEVNPEWLVYLETLAGQAAIAIENISLLTDLQRANNDLVLGYEATIEGWSRALDLRDHETEGHTQRVTSMTVALARSLNVDDKELLNITRGALLHDIGKMGVPDTILLKPGKLTDEEWEVMRQHPVLAYHLLSPIEYLRDALDIPYCHHEKWDGSGYPRGLKGNEIPFAARIFAIADVYDALTSVRPYRQPWTQEETLKYITEQSGTHFDPSLVERFITLQSHN